MPDSTRVDTKVYPRPDFPQQGWINKATGTLFEQASGFQVPPYEQLWASYRMPDELATVSNTGKRQLQWYTDFPQQGWIDKVPGNLYEAFFWPAIETSSDFSYRMLERFNRRTSQGDWAEELDWINAALAIFDPALYQPNVQLAKSEWTRDRKTDRIYIKQDQPRFDSWAALNLWETWYFTGPDSQMRSFRTAPPDKKRYWTSDDQDKGWLFSGIPAVFDPALFAAVQQQLLAFRSLGGYKRILSDAPTTDWISATFVAFDAALWPGVDQLVKVYRTIPRIQKFPVDQQKIDWINVLNLWEVPYFAGIESQAKSFLADRRLPWKSFIIQDEPSQAWIQFSIPPPYSAAMYPALEQLFKSLRGGKELGKISILTDYPEFGWITAIVPSVSSERIVERRILALNRNIHLYKVDKDRRTLIKSTTRKYFV